MTSEMPYNSMASGASQLATSNPLLSEKVAAGVRLWQKG